MQAHRRNRHKNLLWVALLAAWPLLGQAGVITNPNALLTGSTAASAAQGATPAGGFTPAQSGPGSTGNAPTWHQVGGQNAASTSSTSTPPAAPATPAPTNPLVVSGTVTTPAQNGGANGVEYVNTGHGQVMALPPLPTVDALHQAMRAKRPLNPGQVRWVRRSIAISQQAAQAPLSAVTPRLVGVTVHLDSGSPPAVALHAGYVTTLNFVDAYGHPWPVTHVAADVHDVSAQYAGDSVALSVIAPYADSNLAVWLQGEPQPVLLSLVPAHGVADYAVHVRVDALEPGLPPPVGGGNATGGYTNVLLSLTQDIPPAGAQPLTIAGQPPRTGAWLWRGPHGPRLLLRVPHPVLAPAWVSRMDGAAGVRAYVLPDVPAVTVSVAGQPETLNLSRLPGVGGHHG
ncbi:DotH/IcmK family type IV secretion protein [Acidithiobacillus ferriphilus]|uniref:DotH/IcmK family type IV secretion protein n=1 Tax=Acidithiobacillus ferriphilus TaxID=1689834 RepID=UPI00232AAC8A|nr:DotH/IcmK family type IV secretion protein [Acidithiobacillus ferriphilus]WCE92938.1 DotH/IcmK family type IV secretion protein [Acidithiobacillus ferriphilus]